MYAVIDDRGNQIKVAEGQVLNIDVIQAEAGAELTFDRVLLLSGDAGVKVGAPLVEGASVTAEVIGAVKGKKVWGISFRKRKSSRVRKGHRQQYTKVRIKEIKA